MFPICSVLHLGRVVVVSICAVGRRLGGAAAVDELGDLADDQVGLDDKAVDDEEVAANNEG